MTVEPNAAPVVPAAAALPTRELGPPVRLVEAPLLATVPFPDLPAEEPTAGEETFLQRSTRRAAIALPT